MIRGTVLLLAGVAASLTLWAAIHRLPRLGPWLADTARALVGTAWVSRIEDWAYDADDRWNLWARRGELPAAHWSVPTPPPAPALKDAISAGAGRPELAVFVPRDVGPLFREVAAAGDGRWVPVADLAGAEKPVVVFKTLLHPDKERSWAEVFIIAVDLRRTRLHAVAGTIEPEASTVEGKAYARTGVIDHAHRGALVVAFNGGFKTEHGQYGMRVDRVTLLPARNLGCTIFSEGGGHVGIESSAVMAKRSSPPAWWRQTPACMVEGGELHPALKSDRATAWGTALEGGTVVRRSAVALDPTGNILYAAVTNATNARALARAMLHAGAAHVAQLDINWSYPHIVIFRASEAGTPEGYLLFDGFTYEANTYVTRPSRRDFFYLTRAPVDE
jgi:hypothetical protein